jgi:AraC-like DNA-binding protein
MDVLMTALFHELKEQSIGYRAVVESLIRQLIICCVRNYSADEKDNDLPGLSSYDNQFLIIEEAFLYEYNTLTLTDLSARLNLSTRQTQRLLTKHYGMNFRNKITEAKMSAAALMLRSFEMNISDLAEKTGYSSAEHFSAAFKRYYGISAGEYRKKHSP